MSIDAKGIQQLLWRIVRFSGSCCYRFVRKYPVVSGFLIFVFLLYIYFPSVFYFLMYSSPVLVCTAVSIKFYVKTKYPEFQWSKRKDRVRSSVNGSKDPSLRPQKSVRRNARMEVVECRNHSEERDLLFPRSPYNDNLSSSTNLLEENSKLIFDWKESSSMEHGEKSSDKETGNDKVLDHPNSVFDNEASKPHNPLGDSFQGVSGKGPDDGGGGGGEVEVEGLEEGDDEEDDHGNKAVEWTEDDQKNLMDLGLSELERNKRLESLIAKRRAKKLFKMADGKSLIDMDTVLPSQIAPIQIVKNSLLGVSNNLNEEGLQMPGSAPSVLLPTQNPFDLPYDPLEEKPNLMADSFHQEFMPANQKDMFFCRHESFCKGPLFTLETTQDPNDHGQFNPFCSTQKRLVEGPAIPRFKMNPDKGGHHQHNSSSIGSEIDFAEQEHSNFNEATNSWERKHGMIRQSSKDNIEREGEKMGNLHDSCHSSSSEAATESVLDKPSKSLRNKVRKSLNLSIPPKGKTMNRVPYDSSPSPSERRRIEFNLFYTTHRRHHTPTCSIASDLQVEVSEIGSPPSTTNGTMSSVDGDSITYDGDVERDINSDSDEMWGDSFNLSRGGEANREKLRELDDILEEDSVDVELSGLARTPEPIVSPSPSEQEAKQNLGSTSSLPLLPSVIDASEKPEQLIEPHQKPTEELNIIDNVEQVTQGDADTLDLESSEKGDNGAQILNSSEYRDGDLASYESKTTMESEKEIEEGQPSKYIEEDTHAEGETQNLESKHDTGDQPNAVQSGDNLNPVPDSIVDQNVEEDNVSGAKQTFGGSIAMAVNPRLLIERVSVSSPRSVLPQNILEDQIPLSEVEPRIQPDVPPQSVMEDIVRDSLADDQPQENLTFNMTQNAQQLVENPIDHSSSNSSLETLEGSSNMTEKTTNHNIIDNVNELGSENMHGKEDSSIKSSEGESKTLMGLKDAEVLSKPSSESNPSSIEHPEGESEKLVEYDTGIGPSKSDDPDTMEPTNSPRKVIEEGNIVTNIKNSVVNEKEEGEKLTTSEGESQFSIRPEAVRGPEKSNEHEADGNKAEANESKNTSIPETAREEEKSAAEVDLTCNVNDLTNKEILNHKEVSKTTGATSAGSVEDTEHESKILTEAEGNASLSTSSEENDSLDNKNGEEIQNLTAQGSVLDAPQSGEDNLKAIESIPGIGNITTGISTAHNLAVEASKPTESEAKAVRPEENDSNAVAK
ncbi:hypothetical protein PTKIN_Ptkin11bG0040800 [Pterospermum kingtungense]